MTPNGEGWRYLAAEHLLALFRGITSKNNGDFYCLNCPHSLRTKNKLESHNKICENKDFCIVIMYFEDTKALECNQHQNLIR